MVRKLKLLTKDKNDRREELLRPSRYLGYERDNLGMYFLSRQAYTLAEGQFRRAVWLNPFEGRFVCHLAWCLYKMGSYDEARKYVSQIDTKSAKTDEEMRMIIERINLSK
ncbi:MAG: hypothetical protein WCZ89_09855 [Phycisphaerae bacterium]